MHPRTTLSSVCLAAAVTAAHAADMTHGPLVGAVGSSSARVFARTSAPAAVAVEYTADPAFASGIQVSASSGTGYMKDLTTIVPLTGLQPSTTYYYRVLVDGVAVTPAPYPRFTTFVQPGSVVPFSFAVVTDIENTQSNPNTGAPVYQAVAADNPAFVLQIGDFDHRNPRYFAAMRQMHQQVRDPALVHGADFTANIADRFPFFHMWDDHDYGINDGDKTFGGRSRALLAFKEYFPLPDLPNQSAGLWHSFRYGQAEVFMLDLRSQRDANTDPDDADKSMLDGDNIVNGQKAWLKSALLSSDARWKFIVSTVPFNPTGKPTDSWASFQTERQELLDFARDNSIGGVIVMSGDLHSGGGFDDGTHSGFPEVAVPHTNMDYPVPSTGFAGFWSHGILSGANGDGGYARMTVLTGPDRVLVEICGIDGAVKLAYTIGE